MSDLDEEKILIKIDQMKGYLTELEKVLPETYEDYKTIEKRRSTERLLQLSIEAVIDICNLVVSGLDLGLPSEELIPAPKKSFPKPSVCRYPELGTPNTELVTRNKIHQLPSSTSRNTL